MTEPAPDEAPAASPAPESTPLAASVDLPLDPDSARRARATVADVLSTWHVTDEDDRYDILLLTSELVTNAIRHGADRVAVAVSKNGAELTIAVEDGSSVVPEPRQAPDDTAERESGRGLAIISAVADAWGIDETSASGKRVWARLRLAG